MSPQVQYVPEGYHNITPYICAKDAAKAIDFYRTVFGAVEVLRVPRPDGKIGHAEIKIGDSHMMLTDEMPGKFESPKTIKGTPVMFMVYVQDCDAITQKAVQHGAKLVMEVKDQFYGDRSGTVEDPFGHIWHISTHIEDVAPDELRRRAEKHMK